MQLILSSSSPARRSLLARLQIPFTSISPLVDESRLSNESIESMVERLALLKAHAVAAQFPNAFIIGADSVGALGNELLTKPVTHEKAIKQLLSVSGKTVRFYTGLCLHDANKQSSQLAVETYDVHFRQLTLEEIKDYISKESVLECAGAFQAESLGITLVEKFSGDDYTTLIGLPLIRLSKMLREAL